MGPMTTAPAPSGGAVVGSHSSRRLSPEDCRALLGRVSTGHVALSQGALPIVVAVTCALESDGEHLLVRAGHGLTGSVPLKAGVVAFETAGPGNEGNQRWEVIVQGRAELIDEDLAVDLPPQISLVRPELTTALRISTERVTGWCYSGPAQN
jgi:Pyridoxamine 5'-phosphate oxidase